MTYTTDISKLYSLMDANSESYKEIINNEHQLKMAKRHWPMVRAMASTPAEIPPVLVGEKFDMDVDVDQINEPVNEHVIQNTTYASKPKKIRIAASSIPDVQGDIKVSDLIAVVDKIEPFAASEVTMDSVKTLNIVEISKRQVLETVKIPTQNKLVSEGPKLASLFSRLEGGYRSDGQHANLLKLRRV